MADNLLTPCLVIQATEAMAAMEMEDMAAMEMEDMAAMEVVCVREILYFQTLKNKTKY